METTLLKIIKILKKVDIKPVIYGSLGVSYYLGNFKQFGDIDLLVEDKFIELFFKVCYCKFMVSNKLQTINQIWWATHNIG